MTQRRARWPNCARWYRPPLYAYLRRRGHGREQAEDLTQGFFINLLERRALRAADPERGRFRGFLLTALKRYVINEHERATAARRGGSFPLRLDFDDAERLYARALSTVESPERVFDRNWALVSLNRALDTLRAEYDDAGKGDLAAALLPVRDDGRGRTAVVPRRGGPTRHERRGDQGGGAPDEAALWRRLADASRRYGDVAIGRRRRDAGTARGAGVVAPP